MNALFGERSVLLVIVNALERITSYAVLSPMLSGMWLLTIMRSSRQPINSYMVFEQFKKMRPLVLGQLCSLFQVAIIVLLDILYRAG